MSSYIDNNKENSKATNQKFYVQTLYFATRAVTVVVVLTKKFWAMPLRRLIQFFASYTERPKLILSIEFRKIRPLDKWLIS